MKNKNKNEKGIALIETAVVLPFLILCSLVVFDIARLFYSYIMLSEIAREAAINGSRIPQLQENIAAYNYFEHDLNLPTVPALGGHEIIRSRVKLARYLLRETMPIQLIDISSRSQNVHVAELDLDLDGDSLPDQEGRAIKVIVEGAYRSMFYPGAPIFTIRAEEVVGYLGAK